jgi:hypothetical protein
MQLSPGGSVFKFLFGFFLYQYKQKRIKMKNDKQRPVTLKEYNESRIISLLIVDGRAFRRMKRKGLI